MNGNTTKRISIAAMAASLALLLLAPRVVAQDPSTRCFHVHAEIRALFTTAGCASPVGLCTAGVLRGFPGGTTRFEALGLGGGAVGEASIVTPAAEPATTWSYRGNLVYSTPLGDVRLEDVGVLDNVRGTFTEIQRVVGGTGVFENATGDVFSYGHVTPAGDGFEGPVRGEICVPRRRHR